MIISTFIIVFTDKINRNLARKLGEELKSRMRTAGIDKMLMRVVVGSEADALAKQVCRGWRPFPHDIFIPEEDPAEIGFMAELKKVSEKDPDHLCHGIMFAREQTTRQMILAANHNYEGFEPEGARSPVAMVTLATVSGEHLIVRHPIYMELQPKFTAPDSR